MQQPLLVWYFIGHAARHHVSVNVALRVGMTRSAMYIERRTHHFGTMHGQTMQRLGLFLMIMMLTCITTAARAALILSADGQTVYDNSTGLTWLANFNLPASQTYGLGCNQIAGPNCINSDGSMNYVAATDWVQQLNAHDFEGHNNWQLPTTWTGGGNGLQRHRQRREPLRLRLRQHRAGRAVQQQPRPHGAELGGAGGTEHGLPRRQHVGLLAQPPAEFLLVRRP